MVQTQIMIFFCSFLFCVVARAISCIVVGVKKISSPTGTSGRQTQHNSRISIPTSDGQSKGVLQTECNFASYWWWILCAHHCGRLAVSAGLELLEQSCCDCPRILNFAKKVPRSHNRSHKYLSCTSNWSGCSSTRVPISIYVPANK